MESGSLNEAGDDLVIALAAAPERTIAESDFAHDDIVAQEPLSDVVMSADIWEVQTRDKLVALCRELPNKLIGTGMTEPDIQAIFIAGKPRLRRAPPRPHFRPLNYYR